MTQTIQVFVGCDPNNCDLEQMMVLEYSLRKHTSHPVNITWMQLSHVMCAELAGDFHLGDSRQLTDKSLLPFDLVS